MSIGPSEDDPARGYRLRPSTKSVFFTLPPYPFSPMLGPDDHAARQAVARAGGRTISGSEQVTNSWGCRGPEPDTRAALRVLIVGDSFMQGWLISQDQTPAACLQRRLVGPEAVSVLNAGHLGYSPDQYFHTVEDLAPRFHPHVVVVSVFVNDVGPGGSGEQAGWLGKTTAYCQSREIACLVVATPGAMGLTGEEDYRSPYHDTLQRVVAQPAEWLDLEPAFRAAQPGVTRWEDSPLYNGRLKDGHFSPRGAELWAEHVARRIEAIRPRERR